MSVLRDNASTFAKIAALADIPIITTQTKSRPR